MVNKCMVAVCFYDKYPENSIFLEAWANFLKNNVEDLNCEFGFTIQNINESYAKSKLSKYGDVRHLTSTSGPPHMGQADSGYKAYELAKEKGCEYLVKFDQDAFPKVECINKICTYFEEGDFDYATAAIKRTPIIVEGVHKRYGEPDLPWVIPPCSMAFDGAKISLISNAIDKIQGASPFTSGHVSIQGAASIHNTTTRLSGSVDLWGPFQGDLYTYMSAESPKYFAVTDRGSSFNLKGVGLYQMTEEILKKGIRKFEELDDGEMILGAIPYNMEYSVDAPFFHLGESSQVWRMMDEPVASNNLYQKMSATIGINDIGPWAMHLAVCYTLISNYGSGEVLAKLIRNIEKVYELAGRPSSEFEEWLKFTKNFLENELAGYIDFENIEEKYSRSRG